MKNRPLFFLKLELQNERCTSNIYYQLQEVEQFERVLFNLEFQLAKVHDQISSLEELLSQPINQF